MRLSRLLAASVQSLRHYPLRNGLMMLGCVLGVAALNLVVGVGSGVDKRIVGSVQRYFSSTSIMITSGGNPFGGGPRGDPSRLTLDDVEALASSLPYVETWDPLQILDPAPVRAGAASASARIVGSSERAEQVWQRSVTTGEYFDHTDVSKAARVALIGTTLVRQLFAGRDPVGSEVLIGDAPFRVVGVLEPIGTDVHGFDRDNELVIPITTLMRRVMNVDSIRGAKVLIRSPSQVPRATREIRTLLKTRHGLAAGQREDFTLVTPAEVQKLVRATKRLLFLFLPLVAALSLLAGGVVAASLMLLSVNQRLGEIAIRRAVGARPSDIAWQFLIEAACTMLFGGLIGSALGVMGSILIAKQLALSSSVSWSGVSAGVGLAVLTGLVAGVAPARRAAMQHPVEALR